jgi:hypothetical protein
MTPDELLKHPEYNHTIWSLNPAKKGKVAVAHGRGGPINIAYEVHGSGDRHLVVSLRYIWPSLAATRPSPNRAHAAPSFVMAVF